MTDDLDTLRPEVRNALAEIYGETICRCHESYTSRGMKDPDCNHDIRESVDTIRAELLRLTRAEAEFAALKRSPQGTVQAVRPQADGCYLVEVRCDSAGVASLFAQRVALLPVGGETK